MSSPLTADQPEPGPARGVTRISPHVVERIAGHACHRAEGAVTPRTHPGAPQSSAPRVRAEVTGRHARLSVSAGALYPASLTTFAAAVRAVVVDDVERLCGLRVVGVDIEALPVNLERRTRVR